MVLASDVEREAALARLREATAEGRLTLEELSERAGIAHAGRTTGELATLTRDLPDAPPAAAGSVPRRERVVCSHLARTGPWVLADRTSFSSIFATIVLDLRQATVMAPEVDLDLYNLFGTITVVVPEGVNVLVEGGGLFASTYVDPTAASAVHGAPIVRIRLSGPGGTLRVRC
jgi:hypothetical protein